MPRNCTVFVFAVLFFGKVHGFNDTTTCVDVWPKPVSVSCGHMGAMQLSHDFAIQLSETSLVQESTRLEAAFSRCSDKIASTPYRLVRGLTEPQFTFPSDDDDDAAALKRRLSDNFTLPILLSVLVEITTADDKADSAFPALDDDESYVLALPGSDGGGDSAGSPSFFSEVHGNVSGRLTAATVWGAMRGLETLAQLVDQVPPDFTAERGGSAADSGARKVGEPRGGGGGGGGSGGGGGGGGGGGSGGGERGHPKKTGASRIRGERTVGGDTEATKASVSSSTFPLLVVRRFPIVIADAPRYPWRGLLLDTANHFLPVHTLETFLDAMSSVKMNVLHWHVVDSYAFPFESESFPDLSLHGAWHPTKAVYSPGGVAWVVAYAADRGIRVLPEFDIPGHAHSWGLSPSLSSLTTRCPRYANELGHLNDVPLDPSQPLTYQVLRGLLGDATSAFSDAYFHLGGDEVQFACWNESEPVLEYMEQLGILGNRTSEDFRNLEDQFWIQALEALNGEEEERSTEKHISSSSSSSGGGGGGGGGGGSDGRVGGELEQQKRRVVVWEEVFFVDKDDGDSAPNFRPSSVLLPNSTVVESWTGPSYLAAATAHGYDALLAYGWYLDRQTPVDGATTWFWQDSWAQMWAVEPEPVLVSPLVPTQSGQQKQQQQQPTAAATQTHAHTQTRENLGRVLGGEASLWSEQVDPLNAHAQSWPRAAAVAERLWSLRMENAEVHAEVEGVAAGETGTGVRPNTVGGGEGTGNRELADAARRLGALRCRLVAWHILASAPLWSDFCSAAYD